MTFPYIATVALIAPLYELVAVGDLIISRFLEKRYLFYPMLKFECFCGKELPMSAFSWKIFIPNQTWRFLRIRSHTRNCLVWQMNASFNGLTPYFAMMYVRDLRDARKMSLPGYKEGTLKYLQQKSALALAGKDPWSRDED